MAICLNCSTEIDQKEGKREKKFCSNSCRATYWAKNNGKKPPKYVLYRTFKKLQETFDDWKDKNKDFIKSIVSKPLSGEENQQKPQNKPQGDTKKENEGLTMPDGLNWKEKLEWKRNHLK